MTTATTTDGYALRDGDVEVLDLTVELRRQPHGPARWYLDETGRIRIVDDGDDGTVTIHAFDGTAKSGRGQVWYMTLAGAPHLMITKAIHYACAWAQAQQALETTRR